MNTINIILLSGLTIMGLFGFSYLIVCFSIWVDRRLTFRHLHRKMTNTPKGKPTIPPKESDWDDFNVRMR